MYRTMEDNALITQAVIDALQSGICITDRQGAIIAVNRSWHNFVVAGPPVSHGGYAGMSYFEIFRGFAGHEDKDAKAFTAALRSVLDDPAKSFEADYQSGDGAEQKWFKGRITPLPSGGAVIELSDITSRKTLERELARLAATDLLTGLPNRRYFWEFGDREVARVGRFTVPATVIMADLDQLKAINDKYGFAAGDEAIRKVAASLQATLRTIDLVGRIGGEEFALLLPGTYEADAMRVAEKLGQEIAALTIKSAAGNFSVTASFGIAEVRPTDRTIADALARADEAMLEAKKQGPNRTERFSDPL